MIHKTFIKVRGFHLDLYQHVNNARYLEFLEEARWSLFDELGVSTKSVEHNLGFIITKIDIDFRHEAKMNDELVIVSSISAVRKSKMTIKQQIFLKENDAQRIAQASIYCILLDRSSRRIVSVDRYFPELLQVI